MIKVTIDGLYKDKTFDLKELIEEHIIKNKSSSKNKLEIKEFWVEYLDKLNHPDQVEITFNMNDKGDILVRLKPTATYRQYLHQKLKKSNKHIYMFDENCSLFFYVSNEIRIIKGQYLFFDNNSIETTHDILGVSMNERFVFLWNKNLVWGLNLTTKLLKKVPV